MAELVDLLRDIIRWSIISVVVAVAIIVLIVADNNGQKNIGYALLGLVGCYIWYRRIPNKTN